MDITINTPALLFPAIAIMTLGYVNRYVSVASVIRSFKKDYDTGLVHNDLIAQLKILEKRIELSRRMIGVAIIALMLACLSLLFIFLNYQTLGTVIFGASVVSMILSMMFSLRETHLANKSLMIEINDIYKKEEQKATKTR